MKRSDKLVKESNQKFKKVKKKVFTLGKKTQTSEKSHKLVKKVIKK